VPRNGSIERPFPEYGDGQGSGNDEFRLLRYSHIFAAAVREFLESKPLQKISPLQLTLSQLHVLKLISYNGLQQIHEVADYLGVSAPSATKNVDKLERLGLIFRLRSKGDRRATLLRISPAGRQLVRKYEELKNEQLEPVLGAFQPSEIRQLADLLERFSVSLLEQEHPPFGACLRCDAYVDSDCCVAEVRGGCPYQMSHVARIK
jgi:DNA-binding MarR family transcriptional regulator